MASERSSYEIYGPKTPKITALINELNVNPDTTIYSFNQTSAGRGKLRERLRQAHGYGVKDTKGDISQATKESPLHLLLTGSDVAITKDGEIRLHNPKDTSDNIASVIRHRDIEQLQKQVEIYYDATKLKPMDVLQIQQAKIGNLILSPEYRDKLEQLASHVVVRGEVTQHFLMDEAATILYDEGLAEGVQQTVRQRVEYYGCFPKLRYGTLDFAEFVNPGERIRESRQYELGTLKPEKKQDLINRFKDIIKFQAKVAAEHGEGLDIVTPNAFFSGLDETNKNIAKRLFAQAVADAAIEIDYPGFKGLFVHDVDGSTREIIRGSHCDQFKCPVVVGSGDASAPQLASRNANLGFQVAECLMGEALGPAGNLALTERGNQAKEENDARLMAGLIELIFNPNFNPHLLDKNRYIDINKLLLRQQPNQQETDLDQLLPEKWQDKSPDSMCINHWHELSYDQKLVIWRGYLENLIGEPEQKESSLEPKAAPPADNKSNTSGTRQTQSQQPRATQHVSADTRARQQTNEEKDGTSGASVGGGTRVHHTAHNQQLKQQQKLYKSLGQAAGAKIGDLPKGKKIWITETIDTVNFNFNNTRPNAARDFVKHCRDSGVQIPATKAGEDRNIVRVPNDSMEKIVSTDMETATATFSA